MQCFDNPHLLSHRPPLLVVGPEYYRHIATITDVARHLQVPRHVKSCATFIEEYALNPERSISSLKRLITICEQTSRQQVPGIVVLTCPILPLSASQAHQEKAGRLLQAFIAGLAVRAPHFLVVIVADDYRNIPVHLIGEGQQVPSLTPEALMTLRHQIMLRLLAATATQHNQIDFDRLASWAQHIDMGAIVAAFKDRSTDRPLSADITEYDLVVALYHATTNQHRKRFLERQLLAMLDI